MDWGNGGDRSISADSAGPRPFAPGSADFTLKAGAKGVIQVAAANRVLMEIKEGGVADIPGDLKVLESTRIYAISS